MESYYDLLGVSQDATSEEITRAYRRMARRVHPDSSEYAAQGSHLDLDSLHTARLVLSDPVQRARYDADLASSRFSESADETVLEADVADAGWGTQTAWGSAPDSADLPPPPPPPPPSGPQRQPSVPPQVDIPAYQPRSFQPHHGGFEPSAPGRALTWWRVSKGETRFHWVTGGLWVLAWMASAVWMVAEGAFSGLQYLILPNALAIAFGVRRIRAEGTFMYLLMLGAAAALGYTQWRTDPGSLVAIAAVSWTAAWAVTYVLAVESRRRYYGRR